METLCSSALPSSSPCLYLGLMVLQSGELRHHLYGRLLLAACVTVQMG